MELSEKYELFAGLHVKGDPLILYNIWDAGSAGAVAKAGAKALATGSWSVAAAQGFADGQALPLDALVRVADQVVAATDLPVSVDFEGGYAETPEAVAQNILPLLEAGVIGINFEDRVVGGEGLHDVSAQAARIAAIRAAAEAHGAPLFINARTDVFFIGDDAPSAAEVVMRAKAYAAAGADGLFVPGLTDLSVLGGVVAGQPLPVNVMRLGQESIADFAKAGVARISHGPAPYIAAMQGVTAAAEGLFQT